MSVRTIPKNHLMVTGGYSSSKNDQMAGFESLLEKDYFLLLDFDDAVQSIEPQPVRVPVPGVPRGYVPDALIHYRPNPVTGDARKPRLIEVKHTSDLERNGHKYETKFECARQYAEERGWEFEVVIEKQIRSTRLQNLKFLREYRNIKPTGADMARVLDCLGEKGSLDRLLEVLASSDEERLHWLPIIWYMVLLHHLQTDLDEPFTNEILLWRKGGAS